MEPDLIQRWNQVFIGREEELQWLQDKWNLAKKGRPQLCVLRGESGFGKTKIIQKFYSWLSSSKGEDPKHYWPDTLLREQNNLRINPCPEEFGQTTKIPWLWWGIRWTNPELTNRDEANSCALLANLDHLKPHEIALIEHEKRQRRFTQIIGESSPEITEQVLNTATGGLVAAFKSLFKLGKIAHEEYQDNTRQNLTIAEKQQQIIDERLDTIMDFLSHVLSVNDQSAELPLVLILDDTQWIDSQSARFIERLLNNAVRYHWPLLVIATHWEQEWNLAQDRQDVRHTLPWFYNRVRANNPNTTSIRNIDRLSGLREIITRALPGLTGYQIEFLLHRADGNPGLLHEIILELLDDPWYFLNQDITQALNPTTVEAMTQKSFQLHDIQKRRFRRLDNQLQTLLSYASHQGMRFLKDLLLEIAVQLDQSFDNSDSDHLLSTAINPYAILADLSTVTYEFRHRVFYDLAQERFERLPHIKQSLSEQLIQTGKHWIHHGRTQLLPADELLSFYQLMLQQKESLQNQPDFHLQLLAYLLQSCFQSGYYHYTTDYLYQFKQQLPPDRIIDFSVIDIWTQFDIINLFKEHGDLETAENLAHAVLQQNSINSEQDEPGEQQLRNESVSQIKNADLMLLRDQIDAAAILFEASLKTCKLILNTYGQSEQRLRDVSISQDRVADVLLKRDDVDQALTLYQDSLKTSELILNTYGQSEQRLRDVFISQNKIADVLLKRDDVDQALTLYQDSLKTSELILNTYGQSEQRLRDVFISQNKIADVLLKRDDVDQALTLYQDSLKTSELILNTYGQSEQRLRDVALSCLRVACCFSERKQWHWLQQALSHNEIRLQTYPQYAHAIMNEHELLLEFAFASIKSVNDASLNAQLSAFQERYAVFKENR
ncbi:tetratricopeptide repeat protein [Nitrosomonas marina]|uniref:AAA ATPase domain-containing protein n=1 Tax=Nitrosomonas marina TaxID=917 RepID=A0A1H8H3F8_9PROT|nr:tetratricopeptide repeat protein [Nitrosomonas marina]SEN50549.1 hypothetical protein SAMN05216325_12132 [Nitrosomonas marina]